MTTTQTHARVRDLLQTLEVDPALVLRDGKYGGRPGIPDDCPVARYLIAGGVDVGYVSCAIVRWDPYQYQGLENYPRVRQFIKDFDNGRIAL